MPLLLTMVGRLRAGARLVVITFHSLEDRIVKHTLRALERGDGDDSRADQEADAAWPRRDAAQPARPKRQASSGGTPGLKTVSVRWRRSNTRSRRTSATTPSSARWTSGGSESCGSRSCIGVLPRGRASVLGLAALRAAAITAIASNRCNRSARPRKRSPAPAAGNRDAAIARADRGAGRGTTASGRARSRGRHCDRAGRVAPNRRPKRSSRASR